MAAGLDGEDPKANAAGGGNRRQKAARALEHEVFPGRLKIRRRNKGECFAKAYISTAETPPRQDTRVSRAYEDQGWPQSAGGAPQEGPSSAHARVMAMAPPRAPSCLRASGSFLAKPSWCGKASSTWCTAPANAARVPTSLFLFAPVDSRSAASGSASRRLWAARWCATACGGACGKSSAATGRR